VERKCVVFCFVSLFTVHKHLLAHSSSEVLPESCTAIHTLPTLATSGFITHWDRYINSQIHQNITHNWSFCKNIHAYTHNKMKTSKHTKKHFIQPPLKSWWLWWKHTGPISTVQADVCSWQSSNEIAKSITGRCVYRRGDWSEEKSNWRLHSSCVDESELSGDSLQAHPTKFSMSSEELKFVPPAVRASSSHFSLSFHLLCEECILSSWWWQGWWEEMKILWLALMLVRYRKFIWTLSNEKID